MAVLNNIRGYWNIFGEYEYSDFDMWDGQILVDDDGWFEGITYNYDKNQLVKEMIFGVLHEDRVIELIKLPQKKNGSPYIFRALKEDDAYYGEYSAMGIFGETPYGITKIFTSKVKKEEKENLEEQKILLEDLKEVKDSCNLDLYKGAVNRKSDISEVVLNNYYKFLILHSGEEDEKNSFEYARKLSRIMSNNMFEDDLK